MQKKYDEDIDLKTILIKKYKLVLYEEIIFEVRNY